MDAIAFEALRRGALDVRAKPALMGDDLRAFEELKEQLALLATVPTVHHPNLATRGQVATGLTVVPSRVVIGVVASTGGPSALAQVLAGMPPNLPASILIVQHLAPGFSPTFTRWLSSTTKLRVALAAEGMTLEEGLVLVAPDDMHLVVRGQKRVGLEPEGPATLLHRPSGNALLSSLAQRFGAATIGVVLTGMGSDGAVGLQQIDAAGGIALVQDASSSVVDGMPASARAAVPAARVHALHDLGGALREAVLELRERSLVGRRVPVGTTR
jgi:two-component system chemotaxis response regulator CheB